MLTTIEMEFYFEKYGLSDLKRGLYTPFSIKFIVPDSSPSQSDRRGNNSHHTNKTTIKSSSEYPLFTKRSHDKASPIPDNKFVRIETRRFLSILKMIATLQKFFGEEYGTFGMIFNSFHW